MKSHSLIFLLFCSTMFKIEAACSSCGAGLGSSATSAESGPFFKISMGSGLFGESLGNLCFGSSIFSGTLLSPSCVYYDDAGNTEMTTIETNVVPRRL